MGVFWKCTWLLVFDVTDRGSFESIRKYWIADIQMHAKMINNNIVLIGNKCDLNDQRAVSIEEGEALAKEYNLTYIEVSGESNVNVDLAFETLLAKSVIVIDEEAKLKAIADEKARLKAVNDYET
jgi:GTPase SAR1 family protein